MPDAYSWLMIRVATGVFFVPHGMQKLFGLWEGGLAIAAEEFSRVGLEPAMFWATYIGFLEFFGGSLLVIGLLTRPVAFLLSGEMAVAYFMAHAPRGFWPTLNDGQPAVLYCFFWLYLSAVGAGPWSLDAKRRK